MRHLIKASATLATAAGLAFTLAACGGSASGSTITTQPQDVLTQLGCPSAHLNSKLQSNEPPREGRANCHGLTVVTFSSDAQETSYVKTVDELARAFNAAQTSLAGHDWAVFGSKSAVRHARQQLAS